jgi:peroxiredoxin
MSLAIGSLAPDFELSDQHGVKVSLSSFRGKKNVVILFYPFSFTGTCTGELCAIRDDLKDFQNENVQLLAISCDSIFSQRTFAETQYISRAFRFLATWCRFDAVWRFQRRPRVRNSRNICRG